jgi:hypothetical protein
LFALVPLSQQRSQDTLASPFSPTKPQFPISYEPLNDFLVPFGNSSSSRMPQQNPKVATLRSPGKSSTFPPSPQKRELLDTAFKKSYAHENQLTSPSRSPLDYGHRTPLSPTIRQVHTYTPCQQPALKQLFPNTTSNASHAHRRVASATTSTFQLPSWGAGLSNTSTSPKATLNGHMDQLLHPRHTYELAKMSFSKLEIFK